MAATTEGGPEAASSLTKRQYYSYRRAWVFLALQAAIFWVLLYSDFSWLPLPRGTSSGANKELNGASSRWRTIQLPFSWISLSSTGKTTAILALSQDFEVEQKQQPPAPAIRLAADESRTRGEFVITPHIFLPWNTNTKNGTTTTTTTNRSLADLCFPAEPKIMTMAIQRSPAHTGIFLNKLMKVGGSTAAGINIRVAMSIYDAYHNNNTTGTETNSSSISEDSIRANTTSTSKKTKFPLCRGRWDHSQALKMQYGQRDLGHSFLWTVVREPTKRAVSQFFHFQVSKRNISATDHVEFQTYLSDVPLFYNYYLKTLRTRRVTRPPNKPPQTLPQRTIQQQQAQPEDGPRQTIQTIFDDYDFIGITERMAESAVALMMTLNLTIPDVLFANAKTSGGYDAVCNYIHPTNVTADMQTFLRGRKWQKMVYWDTILYQTANRSLDLTIQHLNGGNQNNSNGMVGAFDANLQEFLRIQALVQAQCIEGREVFPCLSTTGTKNPKPDCLWNDSGCGHTCIKQVVQELGL